MGLNNHRRACNKWKNLDRIEKHHDKRRWLEMQNDIIGPASAHDLQAPSEMAGPEQAYDLPIEVCNDL
jgi:hypothetical protein